MAEKKKEDAVVEEQPVDIRAYWREKVPFKAFKDNGRYKDDLDVGYNGKRYVIKRGVEVMIPRAVAEILYQSMEQDQRAAEYMERESSYYAEETRRRFG